MSASLRSMRFRGAKSEEQGFRRFAAAKNGASFSSRYILTGLVCFGSKFTSATEGRRFNWLILGLSTSCYNSVKKLLQFSQKVAQKLLQNSKSCSKVAPKSKSGSKFAFNFLV